MTGGTTHDRPSLAATLDHSPRHAPHHQRRHRAGQLARHPMRTERIMKIGSISGLVYAVSDLDKTAEFYETLGFRSGKRDDHQLTVYVNWFWLTFTTDRDTADAAPG